MICSQSQMDSFWKTVVLSNDCESSMRAMVIEPPRFGARLLLSFLAATLEAPRTPAPRAMRTSGPASRARIGLLLLAVWPAPLEPAWRRGYRTGAAVGPFTEIRRGGGFAPPRRRRPRRAACRGRP